MISKFENTLKFFKTAIESLEDIELKGKNTPYTSLNGHMFSFITTESDLAIRLSKSDREYFLNEINPTILHQHGAIMKEYVIIPIEILENNLLLIEYFKKSYKYISTLKPKK